MNYRNDLTAEYVQSRLEYDPWSGIFTWKPICDGRRGAVAWNSHFAGKRAGSRKPSGYLAISIDDVAYSAHRLAWLYMTNEWPPADIDHKLGDRLDNRWLWLRAATEAQNTYNKSAHKDSQSGVKGVCWDKWARKWKVAIKADGVFYQLGHFDDLQIASSIYASAAILLHEEFARI